MGQRAAVATHGRADTAQDEGVSTLAHTGDLADLPWEGTHLADQEFVLLANPDGTFTRRRFYRDAAWMNAPSTFTLEQRDEDGHRLAPPVLTNNLSVTVGGTLSTAGVGVASHRFGTQGDHPTHPELLDWLASDFMQRGWSMKQAIRTMVTSATYRQSSNARPRVLSHPRSGSLLRAVWGSGPASRCPSAAVGWTRRSHR